QEHLLDHYSSVPEHVISLVKVIMKRFLLLRLHELSRKITEKSQKAYIMSKLTKQVLFMNQTEQAIKQDVRLAAKNVPGPFAATCDSTTISEANIDCYKRFEKEHGGLPRKPNDPIEPTGNIRLLCCMLKYNKYCVPKLLEDKGCHPAAALQSATEIETRLESCPTPNPICVPPPQCKRSLPDAKLICEYRYKKEHGTIAPKRRADLQPRDQGRDKVYKKRCCLMQYNKDCVPKILQEEFVCSDPDFLEMFFEQIRTECGTSKLDCTGVPAPQCDDEQLSNARKICDYKYADEHGTIAPKRRAALKPRDLSPAEVHRLQCCQMEYNKVCVPRILKLDGCSDPDFIEIFLEQVRDECGTSKWNCGTAPKCNEKTVTDADTECGTKYTQEHDASTLKPNEDKSNEMRKQQCCSMEYSKHCVPEVLKRKGCSDEIAASFIAQRKKLMVVMCGTSMGHCDFYKSKSTGHIIHPIWTSSTLIFVMSVGTSGFYGRL
ncbi:uncharacterized protein LOC135376938, partial [Ornithodoros turicata]|uniref:uncharacterized protein LOC135376938 n=1 Tax=Ornithodoros turicata TaxID=34597 RepID=UPI003138E8BD